MKVFKAPKWDVDDACEKWNLELFGPGTAVKKSTKSKKKADFKPHSVSKKIKKQSTVPLTRKLTKPMVQIHKSTVSERVVNQPCNGSSDNSQAGSPLTSATRIKKRRSKMHTDETQIVGNESSCSSKNDATAIQTANEDEHIGQSNSRKKRKKRKMQLGDLSCNSEMPVDCVVPDSLVTSKVKKCKLNRLECTSISTDGGIDVSTSSGGQTSVLLKTNKMTNALQKHRNSQIEPLRNRMLTKLKASRFRFLNEQLYTCEGNEARKAFLKDPDSFHAYHEGYRQQVSVWPLNPLDKIIKSLKRRPTSQVFADFGCGDAQLARSLTHKVHSFDLVALSEEVTACDMAHTPLADGSVDVVVFCLSLMGTNLHDYLLEANRVLIDSGQLKIAEVASRFEDIDAFIRALQTYGFNINHKDFSHNLFYFLDFKKIGRPQKNKKLAAVSLKPCLYKKR